MVQIQPLARKLPCAVSVAIKKNKEGGKERKGRKEGRKGKERKEKKREKKRKEKEIL